MVLVVEDVTVEHEGTDVAPALEASCAGLRDAILAIG